MKVLVGALFVAIALISINLASAFFFYPKPNYSPYPVYKFNPFNPSNPSNPSYPCAPPCFYSSPVCGQIGTDCIKFNCQSDLKNYNCNYRTNAIEIGMDYCSNIATFKNGLCFNNKCNSTYCTSTNQINCGASGTDCISFRCKQDIVNYNCAYNTNYQEVDRGYCSAIPEGQRGTCKLSS